MIDLHNHILPDWDDGPSTLADTFTMARQAVSVGTTIMVATPHRMAYGFFSRADLVRNRVDLLNGELQLEGIALEIVAGVEIPISETIVEEVQSGKLSTLGSGRHLLIEPPFPNLPDNLLPAVDRIFEHGYEAILAHPERNAIVQRDWKDSQSLPFVTACAERGVVIQLTSGSIVGRFGKTAQEVCRAVVQNRAWKIIIASDSHDTKERTPLYMREAADTVAEWIGDLSAADAMVEDLPRQILMR